MLWIKMLLLPKIMHIDIIKSQKKNKIRIIVRPLTPLKIENSIIKEANTIHYFSRCKTNIENCFKQIFSLFFRRLLLLINNCQNNYPIFISVIII